MERGEEVFNEGVVLRAGFSWTKRGNDELIPTRELPFGRSQSEYWSLESCKKSRRKEGGGLVRVEYFLPSNSRYTTPRGRILIFTTIRWKSKSSV